MQRRLRRLGRFRTPPTVHRRRHRRADGFTLLEMTVAMVSGGLLIACLGTAMSLAVRSGSAGTRATLAHDAYLAATSLVNELQTLKSLPLRESGRITVTVSDRNGDAADETIAYAWGGTPGQPLTRQINGGSITPVADSVHLFEAQYQSDSTSVRAILIILQLSADSATRVEMLIPILNRP